LGIGNPPLSSSDPQTPSGLTGGTVIDIAAGSESSIVLFSDGTTKVFGSNQFGQLGITSPNVSYTPTTGPTISGAVDVVSPSVYEHSWCITDSGELYTWGSNHSGAGALGIGSSLDHVHTPSLVNGSGSENSCPAKPNEVLELPCCILAEGGMPTTSTTSDENTCDNEISEFSVCVDAYPDSSWWEYNGAISAQFSMDTVIDGADTLYCNHMTVTDWDSLMTSGSTIYHTYQFGTCLLMDSMTIAGCCLPDTGNLVLKDTTIVISSGSITLSGAMAINGTLTVDGPGTLIFSDAQILMGDDAQIVVQPGSGLTLKDSTDIRACNAMHKGIDGDSCRFTMHEGSHIEDALLAVFMERPIDLKVDSCSFNRNLRHLVLISDSETRTFNNVHAYCDQNLNPPYQDDITLIAFQFYGVENEIRRFKKCVIEDAHTGIYGLGRVRIVSKEDTIRNMTNLCPSYMTNASYCSNYYGNGILVKTVNNDISGIIVDGSDISYCVRGVRTFTHGGYQVSEVQIYESTIHHNFVGVDIGKSLEALIIDNEFTNNVAAIETEDCSTLNIYENQFDDNLISIASSFDGPYVRIRDNTIDCSGISAPNFAEGIYVVRNEINCSGWFSCSWDYKVYDNTLINVRRGIVQKDVHWSKVFDNDINIRHHSSKPADHADSRGINITDDSGILHVTDNVVWSTAINNTWRWWDNGISASSAWLLMESCNTTRNVHNGFRNSGPAATTYMFRNVMDSTHFTGIFQNWGFLGEQGDDETATDIEWRGSFQNHTGTWMMQQNASDFWVRDDAFGTDYYPSPFEAYTNPVQVSLEIEPEEVADAGDTSNISCPVNFRNYDYLIKLALDSLTFRGSDSLSAERLAKLQLYRSVTRDSLLSLDSTLKAFADTFRLCDLGTLDTLDYQLKFNMAKSSASKLVADVNAVVAEDTIADLWKEVLVLAFSKCFDDDTSTVLTQADTTRLFEIAESCPFKLGPAVGLSRILINNLDSIHFVLGHECEWPVVGASSGKWSEEESDSDELPDESEAPNDARLLVYPNPTDDILKIQLIGDDDLIYDLTMYSVDGREVMSYPNISGAVTELSLGHLHSGVYFVEVVPVNGVGEKWRGKVILSGN